jgi:hypothetical protein
LFEGLGKNPSKMAQRDYFVLVELLLLFFESYLLKHVFFYPTYQMGRLQDRPALSLAPWYCDMFGYFEGSQAGRIERGVVIGEVDGRY